MEIPEIKSRLSILAVLQHYGLTVDANSRIHCPFHPDRTPSMQVYPATNTAYCFSSNCKTHGKSMDTIDFIMHKEGISKHEAIVKAASLLGIGPEVKAASFPAKDKTEEPKPAPDRDFLEKMFSSFRNGAICSHPAQDYLASRGLDITQIEVGYNSGQFHHGERRSEELIANCLEAGLLLDKGQRSKTGEKAYSVFGNKGIVFPLKNKENRMVSLYFRSITNNDTQKHYYLKNRSGLYPGYPTPSTRIVILTESIIDAASFGTSGKDTFVLACYGTNGFTPEHLAALQSLTTLEEIIFAFDMDKAGTAAVDKLSTQLHEVLPCKFSRLELPCKDINETLQDHAPAIFAHLLEARTPIDFTATEQALLFSIEPIESVEKENSSESLPKPQASLSTTVHEAPNAPAGLNTLNTSNPDCLTYTNHNLCFTLWGGIDTVNINRLRATLHIRLSDNEYRSFRDTVDLYSHAQSDRLIKQASEKLEISSTQVSDALTALTAELETYRNTKREERRKNEQVREKEQKDIFSREQMQEASTLLNNRNLNHLTHELFGNLGMVGQQDNAMLLFFIFLTRLFKNPLHAIVMGSSGSGKTHLLQGVAKTIPRQHIHYTTSLSENTLYYTPKDFLKHKILLQEDLDGAYNALLPLRELMSNQSISRFSTKTNSRTGDSKQVYLEVNGPVCIAGATTKERIYEDNANRSFLIQIEESPQQERQILSYQGKVASGEINPKMYEYNINLLKAAQLQLTPMEVRIPFAGYLDLPAFVFKKLRTKSHYLTLIKSVTLWNQRNRKKQTDESGRVYLLSEVDDVKWANYLCKESLLRKSDELSGKARSFFESLKALQLEKMKEAKDTKDGKQNTLFRSGDVRSRFRLHPMQAKRYLDELEARGLIRCKNRSMRVGNEYEIIVWNDYEVLQSGLDVLDEIVRKLSNTKTGYDKKE